MTNSAGNYFDLLPKELNTQIFYYLDKSDRSNIHSIFDIPVDYAYLVYTKYNKYYDKSIINYDAKGIYDSFAEESARHMKKGEPYPDVEFVEIYKYFALNKYININMPNICICDDVELFELYKDKLTSFHYHEWEFRHLLGGNSHNIIEHLIKKNKLKDIYHRDSDLSINEIFKVLKNPGLGFGKRNKTMELLINYFKDSTRFLIKLFDMYPGSLSHENYTLIINCLKDNLDPESVMKILYVCIDNIVCLHKEFIMMYQKYKKSLDKFDIGSLHCRINEKNYAYSEPRMDQQIIDMLYEDM